jgi:ribosomal protein S12
MLLSRHRRLESNDCKSPSANSVNRIGKTKGVIARLNGIAKQGNSDVRSANAARSRFRVSARRRLDAECESISIRIPRRALPRPRHTANRDIPGRRNHVTRRDSMKSRLHARARTRSSRRTHGTRTALDGEFARGLIRANATPEIPYMIYTTEGRSVTGLILDKRLT